MNQYLNFSLEGKVALVTGASYGIGLLLLQLLQSKVLKSVLTISIRNWWIKVWLLMLKRVSRHMAMYAM